MEITITSRTRQREVNSPSPKVSAKKENEKKPAAVRQDTYESSLPSSFYTDKMKTASADGIFFDGELSPLTPLHTMTVEVRDYID